MYLLDLILRELLLLLVFKERALDELLKRVGASDGEKTGTAEQG